MTENERQHLIEGYKALMQYGCQMSQDHINYDRIWDLVVNCFLVDLLAFLFLMYNNFRQCSES